MKGGEQKMKKLGLIVLGGIAAFVLLANLGPMIGLAICSVILYFAFKEFVKTDSTFKKVLWIAIGLITLSALVSNLPAIIGIVAAYVLYVVYKKWNTQKNEVVVEKNDPFTNFENEWNELNKNFK
jgi:lia operon protein LiaI